MAEDQKQAGDDGEERLVALLKALGWTKRGKLGIDIESDYHPDKKSNEYGIDGYMTYDGPYRDKERGIIIESKNKKWSSYSKQDVKDDAKKVLQKIEAANHSEEFEEFVNFGEPRIVNSAVFGMWTRTEEKFNADTFHGWVENISIRYKKQAFQILVLGNDELNRLASLHSQFTSLKEEDENAQFFYPSQSDSGSTSSDLLTLEYMISDFVFARMETSEVIAGTTIEKDVGVVFFFGEVSLEALNFMYKAVLGYTLDAVDELRIYIYNNEPDKDGFYYLQHNEWYVAIKLGKGELHFDTAPWAARYYVDDAQVRVTIDDEDADDPNFDDPTEGQVIVC